MNSKIVKEMVYYQNLTKLLIPRGPFCRVVREIMHTHDPLLRIRTDALEAIQEATESFIVHFLSDSTLCTNHAKRKTLMPTDMKLVGELKHKHMLVGLGM